jgi:hypothetical protein
MGAGPIGALRQEEVAPSFCRLARFIAALEHDETVIGGGNVAILM